MTATMNGSEKTVALLAKAKASRPPTRVPLQDWQKKEKVAQQLARMWAKVHGHSLHEEEVDEIHQINEAIADLTRLRDDLLRERLRDFAH